MQAAVFHGIGDTRLDDVREPEIKESTDAIVRPAASAFCGTQLHLVRGTLPGVKPGTILRHEPVGVIEEIGESLRNFQVGDRVVIASTIGCGDCSHCRAGCYSPCDNANPLGNLGGTAFFGGPMEIGAFDGQQAGYARIPFANAGPVKLPDQITGDQAILLSDLMGPGRDKRVEGFLRGGTATNPNLTLRMGNCNHSKCLPQMVRRGSINPASITTEVKPLSPVLDAEKAFDSRQEAWVKVELVPALSRIAA